MSTRGRPKSDQKKQQILAAALELFTSKGYEQTNLEKVAAAAGVSKQTIYNHFSDKTALLKECIKRRCEEGLITADDLDFSLPPQQFLRIFTQRFITTLSAEAPLRMNRLCISESDRHPEVGRSYFESGPKPVMQAVSRYLRCATERGELRVEHPDLVAAQITLLLKGLVIDMRLMELEEWPFKFTQEQFVEETLEMFLRAYQSETLASQGIARKTAP
jgi:TetR/AcrR family transcriptional repressor of mexJK operon